MMTKDTLPQAFEYGDFRKFLDDYQRARQAIDSSFTRAHVCRILGLPNSRSFFTDVIRGKQISTTFATRIAKAFGMSKDEATFFHLLVQYNQADDPLQRETLFDQLIALNRAPMRVMTNELHDYYRDLHNTTIRAMLDLFDFEGDYVSLARMIRPPITATQARKSISLLRKLGLVKPDSRGILKPTDKIIAVPGTVGNMIVKHYHGRCLELAQRALFEAGPEIRNFSTNCISISPNGLKRIVKLIQKFKSQMRSIIHKDNEPAQHLYSFMLEFFPSATVADRKGGSPKQT